MLGKTENGFTKTIMFNLGDTKLLQEIQEKHNHLWKQKRNIFPGAFFFQGPFRETLSKKAFREPFRGTSS